MIGKKYVDYAQVGARIARRRKSLGLKQADVNESIDLSGKYLSAIETGKTIPSIDALMRICTALDTTPDHLLLGTTRVGSEVEIIREKVMLITDSKKIMLLSNFIDMIANADF